MRRAAALLALLLIAPATQARELATVTRLDAAQVTLTREDAGSASVWLSDDTRLDKGDQLVAKDLRDRTLTIALPLTRRAYVLVRNGKGPVEVAAERLVPLAQGSNFRDIGGYVTKDGKVVHWGRAFRSGAQPLLTPADEKLVDQLHIGTVVDLRSLEERQINPDTIDDREGALFVSNDYAMATLMAGFEGRGGENIYQGMERLLAPQYRSLYRRIIDSAEQGEGAVLYHCSAGQDRTGVATAILYDVLGVDRATILADYHLSTELRRPFWEMPASIPPSTPAIRSRRTMRPPTKTRAPAHRRSTPAAAPRTWRSSSPTSMPHTAVRKGT